jgi:hypothetical protein
MAFKQLYDLVNDLISALGLTTGAALDADGEGTIQQYLRGLLKAFLAGGGPQRKLGATTTQTIDATERILNTATLSSVGGYPMTLRLMAISSGCYIYQGASTVALPVGISDPLGIGEWAEVTVDSAADAYFAVKRSASSTGTITARHIDHIGA